MVQQLTRAVLARTGPSQLTSRIRDVRKTRFKAEEKGPGRHRDLRILFFLLLILLLHPHARLHAQSPSLQEFGSTSSPPVGSPTLSLPLQIYPAAPLSSLTPIVEQLRLSVQHSIPIYSDSNMSATVTSSPSFPTLSINSNSASSWIDFHSPPLSIYTDSSGFPFFHGVASGDPLPDRVIIWTRITPRSEGIVSVDWEISQDSLFGATVNSGQVTTGAWQDYTVKIDADQLQPGRRYFYRFRGLGHYSPVGRTETAPDGSADKIGRLRFAVASCANFQHGYFNAYGRIADRDDLNAVLFLGDYFYEDGIDDREYGPIPGRLHEPKHRLRTLEDYRKRHAFYKLEANLQRLHARHPFIAIWDDHEFSDDCYAEGGPEHDSRIDGDWEERQSDARRAYFEWMPVREKEEHQRKHIFRSFRYGRLAEIIMLDSRIEGRSEQSHGKRSSEGVPGLNDPDRTMLGGAQLRWFLDRLKASDAEWKIVGNQVVLTHWRGVHNNDAWDGYPVERDRILRTIEEDQIGNVVFVTGDVHISMASELSRNPFDREQYDSDDGAGSLGVEFITPSIASANFNELYHLPHRSYRAWFAEESLKLFNSQIRMVELDNHGYFVLDLNSRRAQADWYFVKTITRPTEREEWFCSWFVRSGEAHLRRADHPSRPARRPDRYGAGSDGLSGGGG